MINKKQCLKVLFYGCIISSFFSNYINKPATAAEKVDCGEGATVNVVNGVIVCTVTKTKIEKPKCPESNNTESIKIYNSEPENLISILSKSDVQCVSILGYDVNSRSIIAKGSNISELKAIIAKLDFPLERVNMDIWAIELASADSARLASIMDQVNREIDNTRQAMRITYRNLMDNARTIVIKHDILSTTENNLLAVSGTKGNQRLSLTDALFRINMANDAFKNMNKVSVYPAFQDQVNVYGQAVNKSNDDDLTPVFQDQIDVYDQFANKLCKFLASEQNRERFSRFNQF